MSPQNLLCDEFVSGNMLFKELLACRKRIFQVFVFARKFIIDFSHSSILVLSKQYKGNMGCPGKGGKPRKLTESSLYSMAVSLGAIGQSWFPVFPRMVDVAVFTVLRTKVITEGVVKMEVVLLFVRGPLAARSLPGHHNLGPYVSFFSPRFCL